MTTDLDKAAGSRLETPTSDVELSAEVENDWVALLPEVGSDSSVSGVSRIETLGSGWDVGKAWELVFSRGFFFILKYSLRVTLGVESAIALTWEIWGGNIIKLSFQITRKRRRWEFWYYDLNWEISRKVRSRRRSRRRDDLRLDKKCVSYWLLIG